jgi:hypothetical protein
MAALAIQTPRAPWLLLVCFMTACQSATAEKTDLTTAQADPARQQATSNAQDPATASEARRKELAAPTLSSAMNGGRCESQADCTAGQVCMAVVPGVAECVPASFAVAPAMSAAPNGRPAPPVGLLDGQVLREHVQAGRP